MQLQLLKYVPDIFSTEKTVNPLRIHQIKNSGKSGKGVIYLCEREIRFNDNFALQFALQKSHNKTLKIICPKKEFEHKQKDDFIKTQINNTKQIFEKEGFDFEIYTGKNVIEYIKNLKPTTLIIDFNPILKQKPDLDCEIFEVDGHNIIPARFISNKQEYNAFTLRKKIYKNIYPFLTDNFKKYESDTDIHLQKFIKDKLPFYAKGKNNFSADVTSDLSKYINLGFISSQRVAVEVLKSNASDENKEAFLEELIVRKELADNFCLYNKDFKSFSCFPNWAKNSLNQHKYDIRPYIYSLKDFEKAKTHDILWNSAQKQLINEGKIHGYLRMYWAKKILEWSITPQKALSDAIYLNDKYAFDSPSPNGYTGILWAIGGLHDRAFQDSFITGKIRRMSYNSIKKKYNTEDYIKKWNL